MLAAGAADGNGEVAAAVADEGGQPAGDETADIFPHAMHVLLCFQELRDGFVEAGQRAQHGVVVGVRQAADVENEIRVERHAVLEAEGLEHQRQAGAGLELDELSHPFAQRCRRQVAGIDMVAEVGETLQPLALLRDGLGQ